MARASGEGRDHPRRRSLEIGQGQQRCTSTSSRLLNLRFTNLSFDGSRHLTLFHLASIPHWRVHEGISPFRTVLDINKGPPPSASRRPMER